MSQSEAIVRLQTHGENKLPEAKSTSVFQIFFLQFLSPLIYVLFAAGGVALLLDEFYDAIFIVAVLLINAVIGTVQEFHAQRSAESLRNLVSASAVVMRDGDARW